VVVLSREQLAHLVTATAHVVLPALSTTVGDRPARPLEHSNIATLAGLPRSPRRRAVDKGITPFARSCTDAEIKTKNEFKSPCRGRQPRSPD